MNTAKSFKKVFVKFKNVSKIVVWKYFVTLQSILCDKTEQIDSDCYNNEFKVKQKINMSKVTKEMLWIPPRG